MKRNKWLWLRGPIDWLVFFVAVGIWGGLSSAYGNGGMGVLAVLACAGITYAFMALTPNLYPENDDE